MASSKEQVEKQTMKFKGTLIVVKDCSKALKYYRDMFGFELIRDNDGNMELSGNLYLQEEKYWERFNLRFFSQSFFVYFAALVLPVNCNCPSITSFCKRRYA